MLLPPPGKQLELHMDNSCSTVCTQHQQLASNTAESFKCFQFLSAITTHLVLPHTTWVHHLPWSCKLVLSCSSSHGFQSSCSRGDSPSDEHIPGPSLLSRHGGSSAWKSQPTLMYLERGKEGKRKQKMLRTHQKTTNLYEVGGHHQYTYGDTPPSSSSPAVFCSL